MQLTKSHIAAYHQCPKRLWLGINGQWTDGAGPNGDLRKAEGEHVGRIACSLFPDGALVSEQLSQAEALEKTQALLSAGTPAPIFEAAFLHDDTYVRADILVPLADGSWHLIEVKSATSAKDHYKLDLATQIYVARGAGVNVTKASIWHINNSFVLQHADDYDGLFTEVSLQDEIMPILQAMPSLVDAALECAHDDEPDIDMGEHCNTPFECPFQGHCAEGLPP